jgi:hypothetical protein
VSANPAERPVPSELRAGVAVRFEPRDETSEVQINIR